MVHNPCTAANRLARPSAFVFKNSIKYENKNDKKKVDLTRRVGIRRFLANQAELAWPRAFRAKGVQAL